MNKQKNAFTLVELIVVITILAILGTIAFISLQGYSASSRDSVRISDVSSMKTALELFHLDAGKYPLPDNYEEITYGTDILRYQGTAGKTVLSQLSRSLNKIPTDPLTDKEYIFSVTGTKNEFEILNLLEGDLALNSISKTNAANTVRTPRVDGQFNGVFVKTTNYIFPTPSLITSEPITLGAGLLIDAINIKSQVITGGKNIPVIGSITPKTGELNIALSVYSGTINKESTSEQKVNAMKAIQGAYSGSELAGTDIFKVILDKTTDEDLISTAEIIILNKTSLPEKGNTSCDNTLSGETKDFWNVNSVAAGQSCNTHKKTFTCNNTVWKDGQINADTDTYLYESCSVAADTLAPIGGNFSVPNTTNSTSTILTITCPTDAEGSNPIQMYISGTGLSSGGNVWEDCSGTKNVTITTGYGLKTISMKWKDSSGNETSVISNNIEFLEAPTCYNSNVHASPAPTYSMNELLGTLPINTWLCIRYGTASIAFKLSSAFPSTGIDADYSSYFNQSTLRFTTDGINWIVPTFRGFWYDESGGDDYMFLSSTEVTNGSCRSNNTCTGIRWGYQANCNSTGETAGIRYDGVLYCGGGVTGGWGYGVRY